MLEVRVLLVSAIELWGETGLPQAHLYQQPVPDPWSLRSHCGLFLLPP